MVHHGNTARPKNTKSRLDRSGSQRSIKLLARGFANRLWAAEPGQAAMPVIKDMYGLDSILGGALFDADGRAGDGWQLPGWSTEGHRLRSRRVSM
jgi:hypothetical protein